MIDDWSEERNVNTHSLTHLSLLSVISGKWTGSSSSWSVVTWTCSQMAISETARARSDLAVGQLHYWGCCVIETNRFELGQLAWLLCFGLGQLDEVMRSFPPPKNSVLFACITRLDSQSANVWFFPMLCFWFRVVSIVLVVEVMARLHVPPIMAIGFICFAYVVYSALAPYQVLILTIQMCNRHNWSSHFF